MKIMVTSPQRPQACTATVCAPNPAAGHQWPTPSLETPGHPQASLLWGRCSFSWVLVHTVLLCSPRVYFPVLCKFWQLYSGVNGDLLQEDLCHTQSPCPCSRPLPTRTSTGDAQTLFCPSLCGVPGSWYAQGLFEPYESLWQEWGLILNANSPLLPSCWGFSFASGCGVFPPNHSNAYGLTRVFLYLLNLLIFCWGRYLFLCTTLYII